MNNARAISAVRANAGVRHPATLLILLSAALVIFYFPALQTLEAQWRNQYNQGYVLALAAVALFWHRRDAVAATEIRLRWYGLAGLLVASVAWKAFALLSVESIANPSLFLVFAGSLVALFGIRILRIWFYPLAFVLLALPIPEPPVTGLQTITAAVAVFLLETVGIPVVWEGNLLHVPGGDYEVAETCSGWHFLEATFPLALMFAYLTYQSIRRRITFIAVALAVAVIANGFRAAGIVVLGEIYGIESEAVQDHYTWGWFVYFFMMFGLFSVARRWGETATPRAFQPVVPLSPSAYRAALTVLVVIGSASLWPYSSPVEPELAMQSSLPRVSARNGGWNPVFSGAAQEELRAYQIASRRVEAYAAVFPIGTWTDMTSSAHTFHTPARGVQTTASPSPLPGINAAEIRLQDASGTRIVWYAYCFAGHCTPDRSKAKLTELQALVTGSPKAGVVLALSTLEGVRPDRARDVLRAAWQEIRPVVE